MANVGSSLDLFPSIDRLLFGLQRFYPIPSFDFLLSRALIFAVDRADIICYICLICRCYYYLCQILYVACSISLLGSYVENERLTGEVIVFLFFEHHSPHQSDFSVLSISLCFSVLQPYLLCHCVCVHCVRVFKFGFPHGFLFTSPFPDVHLHDFLDDSRDLGSPQPAAFLVACMRL